MLRPDTNAPLDFGIAKATQGKLTDKTLFTRFEQFIGTPVYMSPERAAMSGLDVDTRSDIYALDILLYELLTGKPPFDAHTLASAGHEEMRRIIREVEPAKGPSCPGVRAELHECVLFAVHELLEDAPFSLLDLVSAIDTAGVGKRLIHANPRTGGGDEAPRTPYDFI